MSSRKALCFWAVFLTAGAANLAISGQLKQGEAQSPLVSLPILVLCKQSRSADALSLLKLTDHSSIDREAKRLGYEAIRRKEYFLVVSKEIWQPRAFEFGKRIAQFLGSVRPNRGTSVREMPRETQDAFRDLLRQNGQFDAVKRLASARDFNFVTEPTLQFAVRSGTIPVKSRLALHHAVGKPLGQLPPPDWTLPSDQNTRPESDENGAEEGAYPPFAVLTSPAVRGATEISQCLADASSELHRHHLALRAEIQAILDGAWKAHGTEGAFFSGERDPSGNVDFSQLSKNVQQDLREGAAGSGLALGPNQRIEVGECGFTFYFQDRPGSWLGVSLEVLLRL